MKDYLDKLFRKDKPAIKITIDANGTDNDIVVLSSKIRRIAPDATIVLIPKIKERD